MHNHDDPLPHVIKGGGDSRAGEIPSPGNSAPIYPGGKAPSYDRPPTDHSEVFTLDEA